MPHPEIKVSRVSFFIKSFGTLIHAENADFSFDQCQSAFTPHSTALAPVASVPLVQVSASQIKFGVNHVYKIDGLVCDRDDQILHHAAPFKDVTAVRRVYSISADLLFCPVSEMDFDARLLRRL